MTPYIFHAGNVQAEPPQGLGGKARNLFHLQRHGVPVPAFLCLSSRAFSESLQGLLPAIRQLLGECDYDNAQRLGLASARIKALVMGCELPRAAEVELQAQLAQLRCWGSFSVRSSAANEDAQTSSFAGQLSTWLHVAAGEVVERIKACWASAFDPGVLIYMRRMHRDPLDNPVSVIVQRMVAAKSAGVLFQADPHGALHRQVIAAGYGLGEGIVADKVETDLYYFDRLDGSWTLQVNEKLRGIGYGVGGGTEFFAVPAEQRGAPVLDAGQRQALIGQSTKIATLYSHYQDIEWAFDEQDQLHILQARPITTIPQGQERVFDNSNIIESYPGVILPMTFSVLHLDYYQCMREALIRCGIPASVVRKREDVLQHLVGYLQGRAYYNISNWYRTLLVVPFFTQKIIRYFEQMIGSESSFADALDDQRITAWERVQLWLRFPLCFIRNLLRHDRLIREYFQITGEIRREFERLDLEQLSSDQLIGHLTRASKRFTRSMGIPILNDFFAMIFMAVTREQFHRRGIPDADNLFNRLLANQQIDSTKPVESMLALAATVQQQAALAEALTQLLDEPEQNQVDSLYRRLDQKGFGAFRQQLQSHLQLYGHRAPKELIMEVQTFRESPFHLLRIILASATAGPPTRTEQDDADALFNQHLQPIRGKGLLRWLLKKTRQTVAYREATRLDRGLHFSFFRTTLQQIGRRFVEEKRLERPEDIFYLTLAELEAYRKGCSPNGDLKGLVRYRQGQADAWRQADPQDRLFTRGTVYANLLAEKRLEPHAGSGLLRGTGCSSGLVTAQARVIRDPNGAAEVKGRILVSESTDPGWVFLMVISAGLISERGSLLSHTAIIGRELGIPTLVGVKNATQLIEDGATLTINGSTGEVQIHPAAAS
ncbi:MAG: PEP/pyruvate-binding domain-containing protein [Pseudomonas sp.]|uniref:PEP/pyruvate-binding domain-containing protein n=1 Tax=Pseudomonas sp. TaxID=306 RepID=UPI0033951165